MAPAIEARASDPRHACAHGHTHPAYTFSRCRRGVLRGGGRRTRETVAPPRGKHESLRHTARNDGANRRRRGDTRADGHAWPTDGARGARKKNGERPTKTRSFCAITPRFLRRGGSAAAKGRKAARNHGCNHRKDKNINFAPPNHQQKHVFTPCTSEEMQAEIRTFRRLGRKPGGGVFILFQGFPNEKQKSIDNAQEDAPQIVHFHASPHSLCPIVQRLPAPTLKINALPFRFVGHNGQKKRSLRVRNFPFFVQVSRQKPVIFPPKAVNSILKIGQLAVYSDICGSNLPKCAVAATASLPFPSQTSR